ncbi:dynein axonemal intermediate chain 4-like isoform X2 [Eriocheir sinensis]|uniref:dynein axonemal intermediate chain 4-like isoform X2 n=1 Tax=Eriocheir sinensis TaxID=95602 RepID=UPI0021C81C46|nr:dynein axonemal intermediate chain 4-like isoform X2 [Eriocheir sinensis]
MGLETAGAMLRVQLQETATLDLYYQENTSVHEEDELAAILLTQWKDYDQKRVSGSVRARQVTCQTEPSYNMDKTTQKSATTTQENSVMATQWSLYDEFQTAAAKKEKKGKNVKVEQQEPVEDVEGVRADGLLRGLGWVERQLSSSDNIHLLHAFSDCHQINPSNNHAQAAGRRISTVGEGCHAQGLWKFLCPSTAGRRVNGVTFCRNSQWLVLAAYGNPSFTEVPEGFLCGWNGKRIGEPEVRLALPGPATAVSWCPSAPELCCVALLDGSLRVYRLTSPVPQLLFDTSGSVDKHCAPVWAVEWRPIQTNSPKEGGLQQALVTASEDGLVKEWVLGEGGLTRCTPLMKVCLPPWVCLEIIGGLGEVLRVAEEERDLAEAAGGGQLLPDAVPATVLKFRPGDSTSYLVGTVAGHLLMCRTFERRGSVAVFQGHRGLVTALDWRPMAPPDPSVVFLSAALDDTLRVWHLDRRKSHCVLKNPQASSGPGGYVDACWCPWYNNLIACVHGGGLHLWDISVSTHAPIVSHGVPGATCATFSPHTKNVVVGDASGAVWVVHLEGLTVTTSTAFHRFSSVVSRISMLGVKEEEAAED